jgi:hypothetical protein
MSLIVSRETAQKCGLELMPMPYIWDGKNLEIFQ